MLQLIFLLVLPWTVLHAAKNSDKDAYPVQKVDLRGVRDIKIVGINGRLKMRGRGRSASLNLRVQHSKGAKYDDWHLEVQRRDHTLYLEVFNAAFGKQWDTEVKKELWPEFDIEIEGPPLPTVVGWHEGNLQVLNWSANLEMSFLKGSVQVKGGNDGKLILQAVQVDVNIEHRRGPLAIKGEAGRVALHDLHGDLDLNWVSGPIEMKMCSGKLHVESSKSALNIEGGSGELNLQMNDGSAKVTAFEGRLNAKGERAEWKFAVAAPINLTVTTGVGPVGVVWKGGGRVFLTSSTGPIEIEHSDFLSVVNKNGRRVAEGTKTAKTMGQVFVRTNSGRIRWRQ